MLSRAGRPGWSSKGGMRAVQINSRSSQRYLRRPCADLAFTRRAIKGRLAARSSRLSIGKTIGLECRYNNHLPHVDSNRPTCCPTIACPGIHEYPPVLRTLHTHIYTLASRGRFNRLCRSCKGKSLYSLQKTLTEKSSFLQAL